jgi:thiamine-phosphate pyrophosphorylase
LAAADPFPEPFPEPFREPFREPGPGLIGRSCHDRADTERAAGQGCTYATLSPIFPTPSKPGYGPALTPSALEDPPLPIWALGGVDATNAGRCLAHGATGVAVMGAIMRAADPASATAAILEALA